MGSRLEKKLLAQCVRASSDFNLIEPGDRVLVGISGGKDSYALLHLLRVMKAKAPFDFSFIAVNLDQGHPGFPAHVIENYMIENKYEYKMLMQDTYSIVLDKLPEGKTQCSLCSRLRRGILYQAAVDLGCTKIALGHHADDTIETLLLNIFYAGTIKAMPARLQSRDKRNVVIRPMIYCKESDLQAFSDEMDFPIVPCDLCGSQEGLYRQRIKALLHDLEADNRHVKGNLLHALGNVVPTHLLDQDLRARLQTDDETGFDESIGGLDGGCAIPGLVEAANQRA